MEKHIEIAEKQYVMVYTTNSVCEVEERSGKSFEIVLNRTFSGLRWMLWGGLIEKQPNISLKDAGRLVDEYLSAGFKPEDLTKICMEGLQEAGFFGKAAQK